MDDSVWYKTSFYASGQNKIFELLDKRFSVTMREACDVDVKFIVHLIVLAV